MTNELNRGNQPQNNQRELRNNHEQYNYNRNYTPNDNVTWSQNNSINSNPQTFLGQWPTPWETRKPLQLLIGNIVQEISKFMSN